MQDIKFDPGIYFPKDEPSVISPIVEEYDRTGNFIQSRQDYADSISMPGKSITDLINDIDRYNTQTESLLSRGPQVPQFPSFGSQVDMGKSIDKLAQAINPTQETLRSSATPEVLGTADDLARYSQSKDFQTFGYVPSLGSEQEYRYGRSMTWGDTLGKALGGGGALAWDTFIEGWKGWGRMAEALFTWDASKLMGSPEERYEMAQKQEAIFNKYAIYNTAESENSLFNRQFFGTMLQQSGFTVGAIGQMVTESFLTGGFVKALGLAVGSIGEAKALSSALNVGELINDTRKVQQVISNTQRVNTAFKNIARSVIPLFGTAEDLIKANKAGAGLLQIGMLGAGGIKRELSMFNMARSEAIFEAASTYKEMEDKLTREFIQKNGREPNQTELENIRKTADVASSDNFYVNTGILTVMNRIQLDNMVKSFNTSRKIFNQGLNTFADDVFEVTGKVGTKTTKQVYEKGFFGSLASMKSIASKFGKKTAAWEAAKSVGRGLMKFEGSEGVQELLQEASNKGLSDYYYDLYHGKKGYGSKSDRIISSIQNPITDIQGAKTFLMGALTGRLIAPFSYGVSRLNFSKDAKAQQSKKAEAIKIINSFYADPTQYVKEQIANVKVQNRAAQTMEEAVKNQDRYTFHNAKDSAFAKAVASAIKLNLYDSLKDTLLEFSQEMTNDEFQKAFSFEPNDTNRKSSKQFIDQIVSQMDEYHTLYNNLKDKYGDRIVPELYKNNSPEQFNQVKLAKIAQDEAIEMLTTNVFKARQATKRAVEITAEMAANPNIGSSATELISKLGSEKSIEDTIKTLKAEISAMGKIETLTSDQKDLLKQKEEELKLAESWKTNFESIMSADDENYTSAIQDRAYKAFKDIISFYNTVAKKDVSINREDIDDNFLKMVDYILLNRDNKNYVDAMNLLADPYNMTLIKNVIQESIIQMGESLQKEHRQEVESIDTENKSKTNSKNEKITGQDNDNSSTSDAISDLENKKGEEVDTTQEVQTRLNEDLGVTSKISIDAYLNGLHYVQTEDGKYYVIPDSNASGYEGVSAIEVTKEQIIKPFRTEAEWKKVGTGVAALEGAPVSDKIADIERRRKEELISAVTTPISYEEFVNTKPSKVIVNNFDVYEYDKDLKKYVVLGASTSTDTSLESIKAREESAKDIEYFKDKSLKLDAVNFFWSERIVGRSPVTRLTSYKKRTNQGRIDEKVGQTLVDINAKYDAELAALEAAKSRAQQKSEFLDRPTGIDESAKVFKSANGIYIVGDVDVDGESFFYITDQKGNPVTDVKLDEKKYPSFRPDELLPSLDEANKYFDAIQSVLNKGKEPFQFDGKQLRFGDILVDDKGRKYRILTKGAPFVSNGKAKIALQPLSGSISTISVDSIKGFRLESEIEEQSGPVDPNAFRLERNNELTRIYPFRKQGETLEQASDRLKTFIHNTPKDELVKGISIKITKNESLGEESMASYGSGIGENKHLRQNPEPYKIEFLYNGETIGFATYFNRYSYIDSLGKVIPMTSIAKEEFIRIYNPGEKNVDEEIRKFKFNFEQSRQFHSMLVSKLGDQDNMIISSDEISEMFNISPSAGEYAFVSDKDERPVFDSLDYNTVNGYTYIIDRRTRYLGDGMYEDDDRVQTDAIDVDDIDNKVKEARFVEGEDKIRNYGRYVAVVALPNGQLKFVELQSSNISSDEIDALVERLNIKSKQLKENNLEEKTDPATKKTFFSARNPSLANDINADINDMLYVAVGGKRGVRVNITMNGTGNIKVEFATFFKNSKTPYKRVVTLLESQNDPTKPLNFKDSTDFIERINRAIQDHDARNPSNKISVKINKNSFKRNLSESASISEYRKMLAGTEKSVVKNPGLFFSVKKNIQTPANPVVAPTIQKADSPEVSEKDLENIPVPPHIAAEQAELLKKLKEESQKAGKKTVQEQIQELSDKRDQLIITIEKELRDKGLSRRDAMRYDYDSDPRIADVNRQIALLNGGAALKVSSNLDLNDIENINSFTKWVKEHLPEFISVEDLGNMNSRLKEDGVTVGMFYTHMNVLKNKLEGKIAVGENSAFKYHEAFHAIFRMLLTDKKIDELYDIARNEIRQKGKSISVLKSELFNTKPSFYAKLSDKELEDRVLEEYLADKFDAWKRDIKTPTSATNKGVFRKFLDFILNFFKRIQSSPLDQLFNDIEKGRYRNSNIQKNRFTSAPNIGVAQQALKAIQIGTRVITNEEGREERIPVYLNQEESDILVSTIAAVYHKRMQEAGLNKHSEDVMDDVLVDYLNLYDRDTNPYYDTDDFIDRYENALALDKAKQKIDNRAKIFRNPELRKVLKDAIRKHTQIMGYQDQQLADEFDKQVDEYGDRVTTDNWKETYSIGGYASLSKELRQYLATIVEEKTDEFGNKKFVRDDGSLTEESLVEAVNANVLYNGILKAVAGSTNQNQLLDRLQIFAQYNPEARKFWNQFSKDVDLIYDDEGNFVDIGNKKQSNLFQAVVKGFMQFSVDYYFINKDLKSKKTRIQEANKKGAAKNQFSIWYNAFLTLYVDQFENVDRNADDINAFVKRKTAPLNKLATILKKGNKYSESQITSQIEEIVADLRNQLGISLSPLFVRYSYLSSLDIKDITDADLRILKAFEGVDAMSEEDAREIASVIKSGKNPFGSNIDPDKIAISDEQVSMLKSVETPEEKDEDTEEADAERENEDDIDGAVGRITKIAAANAVFDEQVSTTSYKNAEGEMVYSHQLPTFNLVRTVELQNESFRNNLRKTPFLATNYLLNNPLFNYIADSLRISRIDGIKDSKLNENEEGRLVEDKQLNINKNDGVTFGAMGAREFLISLFELYGNTTKHVIPATDGKPRQQFMTTSVLLGVLEASNTADMLNLPVIRSVEYKKGQIVLTDEAKRIFLNEIKREYDRINSVQQEINEGFPNGIIEGYHNGQLRGLKFIKMGNLLGKLAETLATGARNNTNFDAYAPDILEAVEKYWMGPGGQVDQMLKQLLDLDILGKDEKDKLSNNLLNEFVFKGFKNGKLSDNEKNSMLNLLPFAPEYNISQILISNYLNTLSARQLYIGDPAQNYKDDGGIDEVKRNKGLNGSGPSIASEITAPQLGINHKNLTSYVATIEDPMYYGVFAGKNKEKADAQMWMTVKALRYTLFGLGKLNQAQAELLDKIENGESIKVDDIFGSLTTDSEGRKRVQGGSIEYNAQTNSIKLVYNDGKRYIKTSGVILSKGFTAVYTGKKNGWVSRPGYEELDQLRRKMEDFENKKQTIAFTIPKSASKGLKKNIAKDVNGINDDSFQEHDNSFWRLQLENPSNKIQITDPTQAKQLIIAEQSRDLLVNFRGKEMTLGEVIDQYLVDTEQRVQNNYFSARNEIFDITGAFRELGKSLKQNQIQPKLGKFLQRSVEVLESTGADTQLLEFFKPILNPQTGELTPKYDLNHPITLDKFTQLFLAYFSKGVMSEKLPGHSLALMSNWGTKVAKQVIELDENGQPKRWRVITRQSYENNPVLFSKVKNAKRYNNELDRKFEDLKVLDIYLDDLRHNVPEYDDNGNITGYFTEYMMPPHFRSDMSLYNKDGTISEAALIAFGVRIPSQDKHSFVALKLVDFIPAYYGSTGIFPHELIEISGADFDIDKIYMHIKDTYKKGNSRIAYGTAVTPEDKYNEYLMYLYSKDNAFKAKVRELEAIGVKSDNPDLIIGNLDPALKYDSVDELVEDLQTESYKALVFKNALRELNLPKNASEYMNYVNNGIELNNGVLNNRILDAKIKLLNNENMVTSKDGRTPAAFQVAEVEPLRQFVDSFAERFPILNDILIETGSDVDSMLGQYKAFKNNKEGARNIGPAVNAMLVYAIMNAYKVKLRKQDSLGNDLFILNIDGHDFDSYEHTRAFVKEKDDYTGERIFYHISAIVSAMTDNAKERLAARLGLNINAVGVVSNMVALGVPLETALLFNLQPSVRDFYKRISVASNKIKTDKESNIFKSEVGETIIEELTKKAGEDDTSYPITTELLENNIKSAGGNAVADLSIFKSFYKFYNQTEFYSATAQILKLSKGLGTSNEDIEKIEKKEEMLGLNMDSVEFAASKIPFDLRQVLTGKDATKPFHRITANYLKIKNQVKELQKSIFIEKTYLFQRLKDTVLANLYVGRKEAESFNITLKRDIIAYLGIKAYMQYLKKNGKGVKLAGLDNAMIYDSSAIQRGEGFLDIIDTVKQIRQVMPKNYFATKFLNIRPVKLIDLAQNKVYDNPKSKMGINIAESNTWAKLSSYEQSKLEDSFLEIYSNPATRHLALNLFNYLIVKDGGQFKSGSFIKYIPPSMFKELLDATGTAHKLLKEDSLVGNNDIYNDIFGMSSKDMFNEFTSLYTTNIRNSFNIIKINPKKKTSSAIEEKRPKNYVPEVMLIAGDKSLIKLDLFGGIRKPEMVFLTDEYGNEFMTEAIAVGSFSQDELDKLTYNKELLKSFGFKMINRPDQEGNNRYFLQLPYTIKIDHGTVGFKKIVYYKLRSTGKSKNADKLVERTSRIITRDELKNNPGVLYLFGDNDRRTGSGGQAKEMRGEPNAFGISTKKRPSMDSDAFKSDEELEENKSIITADIEKVIKAWRSGSYTKVVIPALGVGLAQLPQKAPQTYEYLKKELKRLENEIKSFVPLEGVGSFIKSIGDNIALSNTAIYEEFKPLGSQGQWKAGGVTGALPTAESIRKRTSKNHNGFNLDDATLDSQLDKIDNFLSNFNPILSSPVASDLNYEYGIRLSFVGGKLTYYQTVNGKEEEYKTDAKSPEDLLEILRQTTPQEIDVPISDKTFENIAPPIKSTSVDPSSDEKLGNINVDPDEAKKNLQKLLEARKIKKEIEDRKKEDDQGCDSPL